MQLCTGFNDCKFIITQTMKYSVAQVPKIFYKNTEKKFKRKKNNYKELSSFEDRKVNANFCSGGKKGFVTWQIQCRCYGGQGGLFLYLGLLKLRFLEHHARSIKPTKMQKGIITFNPTNLIKVTYISSILKFLNTERLVVQFSNFNIQSLHL